jgi:thiosulfate/3-mercaptopyruvate sulfurtransferase
MHKQVHTEPAIVTFPLLLEPAELQARLAEPNLQVVDLCQAEQYARAHIPCAVHLDYSRLVLSRPPVTGLLPSMDYMHTLFSSLGLRSEAYIVAYDDEGGGRAARLLWSLAACGHARYALLNGGLQAWVNEGHPLEHRPVAPQLSEYPVNYHPEVVAERDYIMARLGDANTRLLDCRTPKEYQGEEKRAARTGHIPGAINIDWTEAIDTTRNLRLKSRDALLSRLKSVDITADKEVITYCQTHHRSAHTWLMLKSLGFKNVRGYPGSWSEWGNMPDTPIESGPRNRA